MNHLIFMLNLSQMLHLKIHLSFLQSYFCYNLYFDHLFDYLFQFMKNFQNYLKAIRFSFQNQFELNFKMNFWNQIYLNYLVLFNQKYQQISCHFRLQKFFLYHLLLYFNFMCCFIKQNYQSCFYLLSSLFKNYFMFDFKSMVKMYFSLKNSKLYFNCYCFVFLNDQCYFHLFGLVNHLNFLLNQDLSRRQ